MKNAECKSSKEYNDMLAKRLGYKDNSERVKIMRWNKGIYSPMSENENCSSNFGVYKGEELSETFLYDIFDDVIHSNYGNIGYDFVCKNPRQEFIEKYYQYKLEPHKEYKIQIKSRCLQYVDKKIGWNFTGINFNNISDYFILCAWENRESLNPIHIWIFHKNDIIRGDAFWRRRSFYITNKSDELYRFKKYEIIEKLSV